MMAHIHNCSRGQGRRTVTNLRPIGTTIVKAQSQKPKGEERGRGGEEGEKRKDDRGRGEPD